MNYAMFVAWDGSTLQSNTIHHSNAEAWPKNHQYAKKTF